MAWTLVTGATGFIGAHLVEHLLRRGERVTCLRRKDSDVAPLAAMGATHGDRLRVVVGDLLQRETLEPALEGVDMVYHLGAVLMGTSEQAFRACNVTGTRNLLDAVAQVRPDGFRRLLFASGQAAAGPSTDGRPIDESHPAAPVSWYGRSKLDAEALVRASGDRIPATIVRPVAVYGEGEKDLSGGTFPWVRAGFAPRLGFATKTACLVYVGDVVEGMVAAAESPQAVGKTYFLSGPEPHDLRDVVRTIADVMGKRVRLPLVIPHALISLIATCSQWKHRFTGGRPQLTRDKVRELRQRWWAASPAAAEEELGWRARTDLHAGMERAVADWKQRRSSGS